MVGGSSAADSNVSGSSSPAGGSCSSSQATMAASYPAVWAKASRASRWRVSRDREPLALSSPSTAPYSAGSTTIPTWSWFFAAARTIVGPPTSISSTDGSDENGYRLQTTRSIRPIP